RVFSADQCFLLLTPPALDLSFGGHGVSDTFEDLMVHQGYRPPMRCITIEGAGLMLSDTLLQTFARRSDIVGAVCATQNVNVSAHRRFARYTWCVLRDAASGGSSG